MDIAFANAKLKRLCQDQKIATREFGRNSARKLKARLADIIAAETLSDLVTGRPHPLVGDRADEFAIDLAGGHRLVFECADNPPPTLATGQIKWPDVSAVKIVFIGDYHD